ncbi:MAG TPA: glucuronate isomerase [Capsulimonadaceae bacterium]|nr:glucuronate isomerase [Capsulimonadaceae bacterium]
MSFIEENFLLQNRTAQRLYRKHAEQPPILDYHNHLPPKDIAENRNFANLAEIWLSGDHYKWRAMRAAGVDERFITGNAEPYEKFLAWARTVPLTLRNPLYHWTHLELKRYFGIDELLNEKSAPAIWEAANKQLQTPALSIHGILRKFDVVALCTTDDPADELTWHEKIAASDLTTRVYPAFRPDKALAVNDAPSFNTWMDKLSSVSGIGVTRLPDLLDALDSRHRQFHAHGCRLSDHGMAYCYADFPTEAEASAIFDKARAGQSASPEDHARFASYMMVFFGRLDAQRGWTKQLHLGAIRNNNTRAFNELGPDTGFDSIGDWPQASALAGYMNKLAEEQALPKMILYNNNPTDNYTFASMTGNFQDGATKGKIQFGSGWWFLDTKEGIEWQLNALSNIGLLSQFVGMLTDSRSFMSFPRHEYFRRVLCNLIGRDVENGEIPDDDDLVGPMIENICFGNARSYLGLEIPGA